MEYLTKDGNFYQDSRKEQIQSRNLDCTKYVDLARLELEKKAREEASYRRPSQTVCNTIGNTVICDTY